MDAEPTLTVRPGRERSLLRRHPWVFGGSVQRVTGDPQAGDTVRVVAADGRPLGRGAYSPRSQLVVRMWTFDDDVVVDDAFVAARIAASAQRRHDLVARTDAARLVFAESDGVPGLIVDCYADWAVVELTAVGSDRWRDTIAEAVAALPGVRGVYERSDVTMREREGLTARTGLLRGDEPPERIEIHEAGRRHLVEVRAGHKTGFDLDQRDTRSTVAALARDRRVLDVFAYTGGFSVAAHIGGASSVTTVDSSGPALALAAENLRRNGASTDRLVEADAFAELRRRRALDERFDLIVLDPPKLANNAAQVDKATRAYKDANLQAFGLLSPGGLLVTFSCSGAIDEALFQKVVFGAALDAKRDAWIVDKLTQASDHPIALTFPEAAYLKGLVVRVA